ncbi:MAG: OmpH family outer membrane protein [Bacteroidales bacterium]|nr:OmpH family outer membrane protein [Bacteroidales bacterium]
MRKIVNRVMVLVAAFVLVSCSQESKNEKVIAANPEAAASLNIRYIDLDSISANYNLVKDYNEINVRTMSKLESAQRAKQQELQKRAAEIENKARNNGYISQSTYEADMQKFQQQQRAAEVYLGKMQEQAQQEALDQNMALQDSLNNFIADYVKTHNYDAILFKNAGAYFNPALDITKEVIDGLNARYKKVESKDKE